ncbi:hypothetical protein AWC00_25985 [Mycobacterium conspicuum]|nr:hypothetical protein [Mycobacterium conspicuum]ORV33825.1 hypothetical protein AWC00_25985 [Mycobacterium conspicuum]CNH18608.1 Uncharacterised protein [Mycobacterium tuberculosis]
MRFLEVKIQDDWDPEVIQQWEQNQAQARQGILAQFGPIDGQRKIDDFMALDAAPFSVVAQHTEFLHQVRVSFVAGAYYPSLTASGALGERILNQLIITMRDDFPKSRKVTVPESFDDWDKAVEILRDDWGVLDEHTAKAFLKLKAIRHRSVHYSPALDWSTGRDQALEAIGVLQEIITALFSPIGPSPWLLNQAPGEFYVALDKETAPVVKHFLIPASVLVSPNHHWSPDKVVDDETYQVTFPELTDSEFVAHRTNRAIWPVHS